MKKLLLKMLLLSMCFSASFAQETLFDINFSSGISSPLSSFSDNSFASNGTYFNLSGVHYFSNLGVGLSLGQFTNPTSDNLNGFSDALAYPVTNTDEKWSTLFIGVGPSYNFDLNKFDLNLSLTTGYYNTSAIALNSSYTLNNANQSRTISVFDYKTEATSGGFYNAGLQLGYKITSSFNVFVTANYFSSFSEDIIFNESTADFQDMDGDGVITEQDITNPDQGDISYSTMSSQTKLSAVNYGLGFTYNIPGRTIKRGDADNQGDKPKDRKPTKEVKKPVSSDFNPTGTIIFSNLAKERKKAIRKIILVSPINNANFEDTKELKSFTWKTVGERITKPMYGITVEMIKSGQVVRTYFANSLSEKINASKVFKKEVPANGRYRWKVQELSTGIGSGYNYFTFSNCEINFAISNDSIECLGYEGEDRKFKICFDVTYSSPNGDLTYLDPSSGLSVFDQTYAPLTATLVSPNVTLVTQIGATTSTVSYCFEVTVSASVTAIGFGLQGDDLDPSPIICQPGVSAYFDQLPDCICDDCEDIELNFEDFSIGLVPGTGNQFNFNGNINVNVPIYGIEFQVQSYGYSATPSACSDGVTSVETSGMLLMPGTTINGSTALEVANETISGLPGSNDNASKFIKYTSTSAITGAIPVNLTIGLPGPLDGLDPSCCIIEYTVCIKVRVFYEQSNCKSCVFTHCFTFNNQ